METAAHKPALTKWEWCGLILATINVVSSPAMTVAAMLIGGQSPLMNLSTRVPYDVACMLAVVAGTGMLSTVVWAPISLWLLWRVKFRPLVLILLLLQWGVLFLIASSVLFFSM